MTTSDALLGFAMGVLWKDGETAMTTALSVMVLFVAVAMIDPSGVDCQDTASSVGGEIIEINVSHQMGGQSTIWG